MAITEQIKERTTIIFEKLYTGLADRLPEDYYRTRPWERRLYELIGIRGLKKFVPNGGDIMARRKRKEDPDFHLPRFTLKGHSLSAINTFQSHTRVHEATHIAGTALWLSLTSAFAITDQKVLSIACGIVTKQTFTV